MLDRALACSRGATKETALRCWPGLENTKTEQEPPQKQGMGAAVCDNMRVLYALWKWRRAWPGGASWLQGWHVGTSCLGMAAHT